jgi:hypothetical protein
MVFVVQDDDGDVANANSYGTVADFKAYHDDRGNSYGEFNTHDIQMALVRATDYLDTRFLFRGFRLLGGDQTTEFPRSYAYDNEGYLIEGIPLALQRATFEYALRALTSGLPLIADPNTALTNVKRSRSKVDVIEEEFEYFSASGSVPPLPEYPAVDLMLLRAGLLQANSQLLIR